MSVKPSFVNSATGVIDWSNNSDNSGESPVEQREPSPIFLLLQTKGDELAKQERARFKSFYSQEELAAAACSRDRQIVKYPRMTEETDVSKLLRQERRRVEREQRLEELKKKREFQPVVNPVTGRIKWS